jgi:predicted phage terminase large subunit-like protein
MAGYSVCTTWGVHGEEFYLLDVFRKKLNFPDLKRCVLELCRRYRPNRILIEDKASGTQLIQELHRSSVKVTGYLPPSAVDKMMRLHAQTTYFESGRVHLREGAPSQIWQRSYALIRSNNHIA